MKEKIKQGLKMIGDYIQRDFYKFCNYMDEQSLAEGTIFLEAREIRKKKKISTWGYHLSTINPTDFRSLLELIIKGHEE